MNLTLLAALDGADPVAVRIGPPGLIGWERMSGKRITDLQDGIALTDMAQMVYAQTRPEGDFDTWLERLTTLEVQDDPTQALSDPEA